MGMLRDFIIIYTSVMSGFVPVQKPVQSLFKTWWDKQCWGIPCRTYHSNAVLEWRNMNYEEVNHQKKVIILGGTHTKSVQPIKNAVFIDDNYSPLVGAVKMCRCGVWSTWWNTGSNGFLAIFNDFALCLKWRPAFHVPPFLSHLLCPTFYVPPLMSHL